MGVKNCYIQTYFDDCNFARKLECSCWMELVLGEEDFDCGWVKKFRCLGALGLRSHICNAKIKRKIVSKPKNSEKK